MKANELKAGRAYQIIRNGAALYYTGKTQVVNRWTPKGWITTTEYIFTGQFGGPEMELTEEEVQRLKPR